MKRKGENMKYSKMLYQNWFVHNTFGHPLAEIAKFVTGSHELFAWIHNTTLPNVVTVSENVNTEFELLTVNKNPKTCSENAVAELLKLGFHPDEEEKNFYKFVKRG